MVVATVYLSVFLGAILISLISYRLYFGFVQPAKHHVNKEILAQTGEKGRRQQQYRQTEPITHLSLVITILWSIFFGGLRVTNFLLYLAKWNRIVKLKVLNTSFLVINDLELGKELLKNPIFCDRPTLETLKYYTQGAYGIAMNSGKKWYEHRKFCNYHLKLFGLGTKRNDALIQLEIDEFIKNWQNKKGQRFSPNKDFYAPIINTLSLVLTGRRTTKEALELLRHGFENACSCLADFNAVISFSGISVESLERIHSYIPILPAFKAYAEGVNKMLSYFQGIIDEKKEVLSLNDEPRDLVDAYLNEIYKETDQNSAFSSQIEEKHLHSILFDLLFAGTDTTTSMLAWAMLHLIRNPDVQEKLWKEIDTQVGKDRSPTLDDRINCPYTLAFIQEIIRFTPVSTTIILHTTSEDTYIETQFVERNTNVVLNIYAIDHDPLIWGDPQNFRPERFLSEDGQRMEKNELNYAFGIGPRKCVGEQVGRDNLFLLITSICQRFRLEKDPMLDGMPSLIGKNNLIIYSPQPFYMVAVDRFAL